MRMYGAVPYGIRLNYFVVFLLLYFVIKKPHRVRSRTTLAMLWRLAISSHVGYTLYYLAPPRLFTSFLFSASSVSAFLLAVRWSSS